MRVNDENGAGHVDHAVYDGWFDTAWILWLRERDMVSREGLTVFLAESHCRYLAEIRFPARVDIGLAVERVGTSSLAVRFGAFAEGADTAAAEGGSTYVCIDPVTRRPAAVPALWREALATIAFAG